MTESSDFNFAVIDTETTGLFPERNDRIIEIAIIRLGRDGKIIDEFCTLINPERDIGPTRIHGLTAGDVESAPRFSEIAGEIVSRLAGAIIVGHNVWFDQRFILGELNRLSIIAPEVPHLCTMSLASLLAENLPSRKLDACCDHFGIEIAQAHSALDDAVATASLLKVGLDELKAEGLLHLTRPHWSRIATTGNLWPSLAGKAAAFNRAHARKRKEGVAGQYISQLISMLAPVGNTEPPEEPYFELLDRVLEDRRIDANEFNLLLKCATEMSLSRERVIAIHENYLRSLFVIALADGKISEIEEADLAAVSAILNISPERCSEIRLSAKSDNGRRNANLSPKSETDIVGKSVCFTGELNSTSNGKPITRVRAEQVAKEAGMLICKGVTKKLDYLVVSDPSSMSGKAKKARDYGTRILAEPVFWTMVGFSVD